MLYFDVPYGYYQTDNALTISGDGMWLYTPIVQTFKEPPTKLLAVKVGPTEYNDSIAPVSSTIPLSTTQIHNWWVLSWTGMDDSSGIDQYEVEYRVGQNGIWTYWLNTTANNALFTNATPGEEYYFRVIAFDRAGNIELYPQMFDTYTTAGSDASGLSQVFLPLTKH